MGAFSGDGSWDVLPDHPARTMSGLTNEGEESQPETRMQAVEAERW